MADVLPGAVAATGAAATGVAATDAAAATSASIIMLRRRAGSCCARCFNLGFPEILPFHFDRSFGDFFAPSCSEVATLRTGLPWTE